MCVGKCATQQCNWNINLLHILVILGNILGWEDAAKNPQTQRAEIIESIVEYREKIN